MIRIIGIDPGTICCGYGIVEIGTPEGLFNDPKEERTKAFLAQIL